MKTQRTGNYSLEPICQNGDKYCGGFFFFFRVCFFPPYSLENARIRASCLNEKTLNLKRLSRLAHLKGDAPCPDFNHQLNPLGLESHVNEPFSSACGVSSRASVRETDQMSAIDFRLPGPQRLRHG